MSIQTRLNEFGQGWTIIFLFKVEEFQGYFLGVKSYKIPVKTKSFLRMFVKEKQEFCRNDIRCE
jgi:hypothetical protein